MKKLTDYDNRESERKHAPPPHEVHKRDSLVGEDSSNARSALRTIARIVVGTVFLWAAIAKAMHPSPTLQSLHDGFGFHAFAGPLTLYALIAIELGIAAVLLAGVATDTAWRVTAVFSVMSVFGVGMIWLRGAEVPCQCSAVFRMIDNSVDVEAGFIRSFSLLVTSGGFALSGKSFRNDRLAV